MTTRFLLLFSMVLLETAAFQGRLLLDPPRHRLGGGGWRSAGIPPRLLSSSCHSNLRMCEGRHGRQDQGGSRQTRLAGGSLVDLEEQVNTSVGSMAARRNLLLAASGLLFSSPAVPPLTTSPPSSPSRTSPPPPPLTPLLRLVVFLLVVVAAAEVKASGRSNYPRDMRQLSLTSSAAARSKDEEEKDRGE
eukprot:763090-Hanusia_phi.AAC.1